MKQQLNPSEYFSKGIVNPYQQFDLPLDTSNVNNKLEIEVSPKEATPKIGTLDELIEAGQYNVKNDHLFYGHRINFFRFTDCVKSCFMSHNELLNIWTHLIPAQIFFGFIFYVMISYNRSNEIYHEIAAKISETTKNLNISEITLNLKQYSQSLTQMLSDAESKTKLTIQSLISNINILIDSEQEIYPILDSLTKNINPENWIKKLSTYHQTIIQIKTLSHDLSHKNLPKTENSFISKISSAMPKREVYQDLPKWPIIVYFICCITCMGCSSIFHCFFPMSYNWFRILYRIDLSAISFLIFGSVVPIIYYSFYCKPEIMGFYIVANVITCVTTFILSMTEWFNDEKQLKIKGLVYGGVGIFAGLGIFHVAFDSLSKGPGSDSIPSGAALVYVQCLGACYLIGLAFYVYRFPECYDRYRLSVFNSHVAWHQCVIGGAVFGLLAVLSVYNERIKVKCLK